MTTGSEQKPPAEQAWWNFVETSITAIKMAETHLSEASVRVECEAGQGWFGKTRTKGPFQGRRVPQENAVTQAIQETLERWSTAYMVNGRPPPDAPPSLPNISRMQFAIEQPPSRQRSFNPQNRRWGRVAERTDLKICIRSRGDHDLRIEAKVVLTPNDLKREYLGRAGVHRFGDVTAPYTIKPWGAMIAYVADKTTDVWLNDIAAGVGGIFGAAAISGTFAGLAYPITIHDLSAVKDASPEVRVVHMTFGIETEPSSRP
jgi:hypothetical protein